MGMQWHGLAPILDPKSALTWMKTTQADRSPCLITVKDEE